MAATVTKRDAYAGETKKQLREGFGVYTYENKFFRYEGEWANGKKHGHGKLIMADGSYYEGEFRKGEINGHGFRYYASSGNRYSGEFCMGELHGQGVMTFKDGSVYEGEWNRNKRQGYGIFRLQDDSVYKGFLYNHMKHGEGTLIYSNGERYDGDWVLDKRQGHGEYRYRDGSVYDGQWQGDFFHGLGTMSHSSGITYEGLWLNGKPADLASKLKINATGPLELMQGVPFMIEVHCTDDNGELVESTTGRELQITAGYKYTPPKPPTETKTKSSKAQKEPLFEVIEDVEDVPMETPFGYSVVSYPITDQYIIEEIGLTPEGSTLNLAARSGTEVIQENEILETVQGGIKTDMEAGESAAVTAAAVDEVQSESSQLQETATVATSSEMMPLERNVTIHSIAEGDTLTLPPVSHRRSEGGIVIFNNLVLPAPPPMYRPFQVVEEEVKDKKDKKKKMTKEEEAKAAKPKKLGDERFARPGEPKPAKSSSPSRSTSSVKSDLEKGKKNKTPTTEMIVEEAAIKAEVEDGSDGQDCPFAPPGEYVIMVHDVSTPPFMGVTLEPAYVQVKMALPKKPKKALRTKDKGPRWDTSKHITQAVTDSNAEKAAEEFAALTRTASQSILSIVTTSS